jgi:LEA14-like dessication related protein
MRWSVTLLAALVTACATTKFEAPNLHVVNMEMLESSNFFTQRVKVRVRVQNPNDIELPIKGVNATLFLQGEKFATGVSAESFTVPPFGEGEFDLMVDASVAGALIRILGEGKSDQLMQSGLDYRLTGKVSLSSGMIRSIPFDETGTLKPPDSTPPPGSPP